MKNHLEMILEKNDQSVGLIKKFSLTINRMRGERIIDGNQLIAQCAVVAAKQ